MEILMLVVTKVEITDYSFIYHTIKGKVIIGHKDFPVSLDFSWKGSSSYKEFTIEEAVQYHAKNLNMDIESSGRVILAKERVKGNAPL